MLLPRTARPPGRRPHPAAGVLLPWPAVLFTWGPGGASAPHAHHAWHLVVGLDAPLRLRGDGLRGESAAGAVLTAPEARHAVDGRGTRVGIVFVAPESDTGQRLRARGGAAVEPFAEADAERLRRLLSPEGPALEDPAAAIGAALSLGADAVAPPHGSHPAVRRVLRWLHEAPPGADTSLEALAVRARLSPGRFMHAFTETVGIPLRPYLRWLRLERAAGAIGAGATASEAAHAAGFADAAHLSRTFRRMFGVTPTDAARRSQSVQDR